MGPGVPGHRWLEHALACAPAYARPARTRSKRFPCTHSSEQEACQAPVGAGIPPSARRTGDNRLKGETRTRPPAASPGCAGIGHESRVVSRKSIYVEISVYCEVTHPKEAVQPRDASPGRGSAASWRSLQSSAWGLAVAGLALALALAGCESLPPGARAGDGISVHTAPPPSSSERYCAWYGAARGRRALLRPGRLLVGHARRRRRPAGRPGAARPPAGGPLRPGAGASCSPRFRWGEGGERSGVWDVLPLPDAARCSSPPSTRARDR